MSRAEKQDQTPWEVQDLRERLFLARAEQVKLERTIRDVLRDPRNRGTVLPSRAPLYARPADAVGDLRLTVGRMAYLSRPGLRNRTQPEVLLGRYERAVALAASLDGQLAEAERRHGRRRYGAPPESGDDTPVLARHVDWLWASAPVPLDVKMAGWTRNALVRNGYVTVAALTGATERDLEQIRTFGDSCMAEVRRVLDANGLALAGDQS
jgi:hypothetical protein